MSSKKARKSKLEDSDSDSGPEDRTPAAKKPKTEKASGSTDEDNMFQLAKMRFVSVREFRGKVMVDIREFYDKDGDLRPGKKGICLSMDQWNALKGHIDDIDEAIKKF